LSWPLAAKYFFYPLQLKPFFFLTVVQYEHAIVRPGNTKGGSITLPLTSCLTGLESAV
jgi:hypothetical protein